MSDLVLFSLFVIVGISAFPPLLEFLAFVGVFSNKLALATAKPILLTRRVADACVVGDNSIDGRIAQTLSS
jgi:hypothetical protein